VLEALEVRAAAPEDVRREETAQLHAELHVLAPERRPVERVPEPEQRLHALELLLVAVAVVLRLERDVARVEHRQREPRGLRQRRILERRVELTRVLRVPEPGERVAAERRTVGGGIGQALAQRPEPILHQGLGGAGRKRAKRDQWHGRWRSGVPEE
jgi:hypothetical protein